MQFEYQMLVLMTFFFLFAWFPVSVAKGQSFGMKWLASNRVPLHGKELPAWGARCERAYNNLKDYFPGFVVAILLLGTLNKFDQTTAIASALYVIGRIAHYVFYGLGNFQMRFLSYLLAMGGNVYLLIRTIY